MDPDADVRLAQQPPWPFEYGSDPSTAAVRVNLDRTPAACLGHGTQLGYLPQPVRHQLGW